MGKITKKQPNKKVYFLMLAGLVVFELLRAVTGPLNYYPRGGDYFYSDLSITNGINITRGYGELESVDPRITRLLFNKTAYPLIIVMKSLTEGYVFISKVLFG